jgi:hypothetical protein
MAPKPPLQRRISLPYGLRVLILLISADFFLVKDLGFRVRQICDPARSQICVLDM